jgi:uncharacterized membrane protein YqgA involved in biofilm formation
LSSPVTGTVINVATVVAGGTLGILLGNRLPEQMRQTVLQGLGLMTLVVGVSMAITTRNILIPLFAVLIGGIVGEMLDLNDALERLGRWAEMHAFALGIRFGAVRSDQGARNDPYGNTVADDPPPAMGLASGFIMASLVFCVGPLAILGSIQNGLMGDYTLLAIKSLMDGFTAMALAASLGGGVVLSAVTVLLYQGSLSILAMLFATALGGVTRTTPWVVEMTATGGVVILSIALLLLDIKRIRAANLLPAILIAPLIVIALDLLAVR